MPVNALHKGGGHPENPPHVGEETGLKKSQKQPSWVGPVHPTFTVDRHVRNCVYTLREYWYAHCMETGTGKLDTVSSAMEKYIGHMWGLVQVPVPMGVDVYGDICGKTELLRKMIEDIFRGGSEHTEYIELLNRVMSLDRALQALWCTAGVV
jgi:hypothetical protein